MFQLCLRLLDVDFWEGYNEPGCGSKDDMTWLGQFEAERVRLLASTSMLPRDIVVVLEPNKYLR